MSLFNYGDFKLHAGSTSNFLIDADALSDSDLEALAWLVVPLLQPFGLVTGIPRGGLRFAKAIYSHAIAVRAPRNHNQLLVDDVATTGTSFRELWTPHSKGVVIFNRSSAPIPGVLSIFNVGVSL